VNQRCFLIFERPEIPEVLVFQGSRHEKRICKLLLVLHILVGTPSGVRTTWGGVRNIENRRFDALPTLTYPRNYPY